jgi:protein SPT2
MEEEGLPEDISSTIWNLFGRKRDKYIGMDVFSDDEDMEADADDLEHEEMFRLAFYFYFLGLTMSLISTSLQLANCQEGRF